MEQEKIVAPESPFDTKEDYKDYLTQLKDLRAKGESKIKALKDEIRDIKLNKQVDKETREKIINSDNKDIEEAKIIQTQNKAQVKALVKQSCKLASDDGNGYYQQIKVIQDDKIAAAKEKYKNKLVTLKQDHEKRLAAIGADLSVEGLKPEEIKAKQAELKVQKKAESILYKSKKEEAHSNRDDVIDKCKETKYSAYLEKYSYYTKVRDNTHSIGESLEFKYRTYLYQFKAKEYLLRNALYFIIIAFFIVCIAMQPTLFSSRNFTAILSQSSSKMFYSLGVAGLILIAGTDLSIGRLTGLGTTVACMVISSSAYQFSGTVGGGDIDFTQIPFAGQLALALVLCIVLCVLFTSIAGFFTAKFKMHPFITTLATQLISYGLLMVLFANTPAFKMDSTGKNLIAGPNGIYLIIYAVIAIIITWFIWNKTKFGKYMYAVGGNAEAASVSGINVFAVTMGIFVMAGVLYGCGGLVEAARVGSGNPGTGTGTELDAIAACVVGGISFSGGIGKISGAVIGTIIFTGMTYCLTYLGIDSNFQFIFKGIIIMAAVCLDSLKYLKRK